ncbi:protein phosphatase 1B [Caerostris darwini]|uniref:protein-serine/threonine phosphatase n=1 Tax=Caerostris darwini TaxID=1538125 RepID=A0AAV4TFQ5_9ARAC|nr:protein phosphatase 1B [Caerostris darwini]
MEPKSNKGRYLLMPHTEIYCKKGSGNGLHYCISNMQGWRSYMEDEYCAMAELPHIWKKWSFFAIFDGHGGSHVSAYCSKHLLPAIIDLEIFDDSCTESNNGLPYFDVERIKLGIKEGFLKFDESLKEKDILQKKRCGSTATCILISSTNIFFINCGDSQCILSRDKKIFFKTKDHNPSCESEKERILKAGASITLSPQLRISRINGKLSVSRALGDFSYKCIDGIGPLEQPVSPEPDIDIFIRDDKFDEFIILISDGVYNISSHNICNFVRYMLQVTDDLIYISNCIINACLTKLLLIIFSPWMTLKIFIHHGVIKIR